MSMFRCLVRLVRKLLRKKEPPLTVVEWDIVPYSFEIDWFVGPEGGFVSSRRLS